MTIPAAPVCSGGHSVFTWIGNQKKEVFQFFILNDLRIRKRKLEMNELFKKMKGKNEK